MNLKNINLYKLRTLLEKNNNYVELNNLVTEVLTDIYGNNTKIDYNFFHDLKISDSNIKFLLDLERQSKNDSERLKVKKIFLTLAISGAQPNELFVKYAKENSQDLEILSTLFVRDLVTLEEINEAINSTDSIAKICFEVLETGLKKFDLNVVKERIIYLLKNGNVTAQDYKYLFKFLKENEDKDIDIIDEVINKKEAYPYLYNYFKYVFTIYTGKINFDENLKYIEPTSKKMVYCLNEYPMLYKLYNLFVYQREDKTIKYSFNKFKCSEYREIDDLILLIEKLEREILTGIKNGVVTDVALFLEIFNNHNDKATFDEIKTEIMNAWINNENMIAYEKYKYLIFRDYLNYYDSFTKKIDETYEEEIETLKREKININ